MRKKVLLKQEYHDANEIKQTTHPGLKDIFPYFLKDSYSVLKVTVLKPEAPSDLCGYLILSFPRGGPAEDRMEWLHKHTLQLILEKQSEFCCSESSLKQVTCPRRSTKCQQPGTELKQNCPSTVTICENIQCKHSSQTVLLLYKLKQIHERFCQNTDEYKMNITFWLIS